jgi:phosphate:Na+ symporter
MLTSLSQSLGGLGLFMLGMWLMTEGLRLAAGPALTRLLASGTSSRLRGLGSGILITALVQSSSAVTVAVLGFVNAGVLPFQRAVWVVFGSNVGTTLTAWLVALIGFRFKVDALALPLIGVGALLRAFAPRVRLQSLGMALAGFGVLFFGIQVLGDGFQALGQRVRFEPGQTVVLMVGLGLLLTTLMQSSSAAIALVLSALAGGLVSLEDAAAVVIGANIGTTTTALLATLGATANARRLSMAHVGFNLITGVVALLMLPWFLSLVLAVAGSGQMPAVTLAIFHTAFNLLGVLLMWPIEPAMTRQLQRWFRQREQSRASLRHLDQNVAAVPHLAVRALILELDDALDQTPRVLESLSSGTGETEADRQVRQQRLEQLGEFFIGLSAGTLSEQQSRQFSIAWRVQHNLGIIEDSLKDMAELLERLRHDSAESVMTPLIEWLHQLSRALREMDNAAGPAGFEPLSDLYERTKMRVLEAGLGGRVPRQTVEQGLQACSLSRRVAEHWLRGCAGVSRLRSENTEMAAG